MKSFLKSLLKMPFRWVDPMFYQHDRLLQSIHQVQVDRYVAELRSLECHKEVSCLIPHGFKAFSQFDEDGIIEEIFNRIGICNSSFVEIGIGDGLENNSLYLLQKGWSGMWIDGAKTNVNAARAKFSSVLDKTLTIKNEFVTPDNVNAVISDFPYSELDFFSLDVDGNDYHIWKSITYLKPRVVCLEYNAKFRPPVEWVMKRNDTHWQDKSDYFGASLKSMELLSAEKGYSLVGCSLTGANAFFVRNDLVGDKFLAPFTAEKHYQPCRYPIAWRYRSGMSANFGPKES